MLAWSIDRLLIYLVIDRVKKGCSDHRVDAHVVWCKIKFYEYPLGLEAFKSVERRFDSLKSFVFALYSSRDLFKLVHTCRVLGWLSRLR